MIENGGIDTVHMSRLKASLRRSIDILESPYLNCKRWALLFCAMKTESHMTIRLVTENGKFVRGTDPAQFAPLPTETLQHQEKQRSDGSTPQPDSLPMLLSVKQAMRELGLGKTKIFAMMRSGALERIRIDGRSLITSASVVALAEGK